MKDEELNKKDATVNPQTDPEQIEKEVTVGGELVEGEVVDGVEKRDVGDY